MSKEYKLNNFADLLELEDDQIERLCAELPGMLATVKAYMSLAECIADATSLPDPVMGLVSPLTWIDDGKQDQTIRVNTEFKGKS